MLRSFRFKIGLMSLCLSALMLAAFGLFAVSVLNRVGIDRIDSELRALADSQVRMQHRPEHWHRFEESLRTVHGMDESKQFIVKITQRGGGIVHATSDWPIDLAIESLPLSLKDVPQSLPQLMMPPPRVLEPRPARSPPNSKNSPLPPGIEQRPRPRPGPREMGVRGPVYATLGGNWRAISMDNEEIALSIAVNLAGLQAETRSFRNTLFIGAPVGLLLLVIGGWIIGHLALRPVDRIARTAEAVTARRLDARIPDENADEEFKRLIALFNGMLERLERSFQQATRFSADAAHELKTPLAILQAQVERSLQRSEDGSPVQRECAEQLDEVQRLKSILRKLLLLSQADAGKLPLSPERIDFAGLVRGSADGIEILAPDRRVTVETPTELLVQGDGDLLKQLVENLISNAIKFGDTGGLIEITLKLRDEEVVLTVANSGRAIPLEDRERIFERFYRVDPSRSRETEGTGLGLSLAREIAKAHGGDLTLEQSDSNLTRFAFLLPRKPL